MPLMEALLALIRRLQVDDWVMFLGFAAVSGAAISAALYAGYHLFHDDDDSTPPV